MDEHPADGLTGELSTESDYRATWPWADAFDAAGYTGVLYRGRFALSEVVAIFGEAGIAANPPAAAKHRALDFIRDLPGGMVETLGDLATLEVAPPP